MIKTVMYAAGLGGCALGAIGSVPLAISNAEWDYYHQSSRQLFGWLLCFVPMIVAFAAVAVYLLQGAKKSRGAKKANVDENALKIRLICLICAVLCALLPVCYMVVFGDFSMLNMVSACMLFGFVLVALALRALVHENIIEEQEEGGFDMSVVEEFENEGI